MGPPASERLRALLAELDAEWSAEPAAPRLRRDYRGDPDGYSSLVARIERAAGTALPALIEGAPGGPQALVALTIHQTGATREGPFRRVRGAHPPAGWEAVAESAVSALSAESAASVEPSLARGENRLLPLRPPTPKGLWQIARSL